MIVCVAECKALKRDHAPLRPGYRYGTVSARYGRCLRRPSYPLCSDDEWVSRNVSFCLYLDKTVKTDRK